MNDFVITTQAQQALEMCKTVQTARQYNRMGQITGNPGTGKSALTYWLAAELHAVRVEAWSGMGDKALLAEIAKVMAGLGFLVSSVGTAPSILRSIKECCDGLVIIIDEANHLKWSTLEKLRALSDIGGACVILVGTDLLARTLQEARVRHYLAQLRGRIGTKRIVMEPITDDAELAAYILAPRFGKVTKTATQTFYKFSKGHWRVALELADACERLMKNEGLTKLDPGVIKTAATWMAGQ